MGNAPLTSVLRRLALCVRRHVDMAVADNVRLNRAITPKDGETGPTQNTLISEPASRQAERQLLLVTSIR